MFNRTYNFIEALKPAAAFGVVFVVIILLFVINDIIITFLTAIIFAIALDRPIDRLVNWGIPRVAAAVTLYVVFLGGVALLFYLVFPALAKEMRIIAGTFALQPTMPLAETVISGNPKKQLLEASEYIWSLSDTLTDIIATNTNTIFASIYKVFNTLFSFLVIFFVALFLNSQPNGVRHFVSLFVPQKGLPAAMQLFDKIQNSFGGWLWGKTISSILVGLIIYLSLSIIGLPYKVTLALLATVLNFIPFIGPTISAVPAVLLAIGQSPILGLVVAGVYVLTNVILESFILMPILMKSTLQMNPALLILFVLIGGKIGGILGIIIAIPLAAIVPIIVEEYKYKSII